MKDKSDIWLYIFTCVIAATLFVIIWTHAIYVNSDNFAQAIWSELQLLGEAIKGWQALIGSVIATAAAGGTVWAIFQQIRQSKDLQAQHIEREFNAQRALLRFSLTIISDYTNDCWDRLDPLISAVNHDLNQEQIASANLGYEIHGNNSPQFNEALGELKSNPPRFPQQSAIEQIVETLKFSTGRTNVEGQLISDFLHSLQVQHSRFQILFNLDTNLRNSVIRRMQELSELDRRLDKLFDIARGRQTTEFTDAELKNIGQLQLRSARLQVRSQTKVIEAMETTDYDSMCTTPQQFVGNPSTPQTS